MTVATGIEFVHTDGGSGRRYVIEPMTAGCAIFDYDGDGWQDLYFVNGSPLPGTDVNESPRNALYRNLGNWKFVDVTEQAGIGDQGYGLGVTAADSDNDGDTDLYLSNYGRNVFYINNGDGTFSDASLSTNTHGGLRFGAGATFFDMDADGDLDLYCANYQKFTFDQHLVRMIDGHQFHPGPLDYPPDTDLLFRNDGNGHFTDVSGPSGISSFAGTGMGVISPDIDGDGDSDLFVVNDSLPNFLFINDGHGNFTEEAILAGLAFDGGGHTNGNMGVDCGDADGDGLLDLITTTYQSEMPVLYRNLGAGLFDDATNRSGLPRTLFPHVNWGVSFSDFDNDADLDIFIACGHFMDNIRFIDDRTTMKVRNYLLENDGTGRFTDVSPGAGGGLSIVESSRGTAIDDLDRDGDLDAVIVNFNAPPTVLKNLTEPTADWLQIRLVGIRSNRDGIGARVTLRGEQLEQVAEVYAGRGYQSSFGTAVHFGLGSDVSLPVTVTVKWPGTQREQVYVVNQLNRAWTLTEAVE